MNTERYQGFTNKLLDRALKYHGEGNTWKEVANLLNVPYGSLQVALSRRKKGKWFGKREQSRATTAAMVSRFLGGENLRDIAGDYGVSWVAVHRRLSRVGVDGEVRQELRRELRV